MHGANMKTQEGCFIKSSFTEDGVCVVTAVGASYVTKHKLFAFQQPDAPNKTL